MRNMGNIAGDVDELRSQRDARKNPPQYEAGQGSDDDWGAIFSDEGSSSSMDEMSFRGSEASSGFDLNSNSMSQFNQGMNNPNMMAKNMTSQEDQFFDALKKIGVLLFGWTKDVVKAMQKGFSDSDAFFWTVFGKRVLYVGGVTTIIGALFFILGLVTDYFSGGFWVIIGGLLTAVIGLVVFSFNYENADEARENRESVEQEMSQEPLDEEADPWNTDSEEEENPWGDFSEEEEDEDDGYEEGIDDVWGMLDEIENESSVVDGPYEEDINIHDAITSIRDIPANTQTRAYLYEEYSRVLPIKNPEFAKLKTITDESDNFIIFDKILQDAALQVGMKEDNLPELLELRENNFIIQLKSTRPTGLKEDDIANEIANIYSKDDFGGILHEGVYATTSSVGSSFIINLFKGEDSIVTLADTYREVGDYVLDPKVGKPVVVGVNELGRVWKFDADDVLSYIISGKPRSGKSWMAVSIILQLCMYSSPKEVTFEVFDVKGESSDYYVMKDSLPHFKRFESKKDRILNRLRYITTTEADRRKRILKDNDSIAIADLKRKGTDADIPFLYVVIDEIVGLTGSFSKDEHAEFKDLVNTLITQMPNLGIKLILVPHRVTNDIVPKTTYVNVGCIACVRSEKSEIKNVLDVSAREFPYGLTNKGDMALKASEINRGNTVFCHGIAITTSNEANRGVYDFIGTLWRKLEPDLEEGLDTSKNKNEQYKGHDLVGINEVIKDENYIDKEDDVEEDFWKDILGE